MQVSTEISQSQSLPPVIAGDVQSSSSIVEVVERDVCAPEYENLVVRIGDVRVVYNPRTYFEPKAMAELAASMRAQGLLQPLLVRKMDDHYELIAGERRLRAAHEVYGPDGVIPVLSRYMTDEQAALAAVTENIQREDMSPTEESAGALQAMALYGGDRDEVARRIGWSRSKLDSRLALHNCIPAVQTALNERKIMLGHAELLAAVVKKVQAEILPMIIERNISVADLKAEIAAQALRLDTARFDKTECLTCHHNSSNQRTLFAEAIDDARCTQKSCFDAKNDALIESVKKSLEGQYQRIQVVRPGDNLTVIALKPDGDTGVGAEQAEACKGCANFGVLISATPGKVGLSYPNYCMDVACNKEKNAAYLATINPPAAKAGSTGGSGKKAAGQPASKGSSAGKSASSAKPAVSAESNRVKEYREKTWREVVRTVMVRSPAKTELLIITLASMGLLRHIDTTALAEQIEKAGGKPVGAGIGLFDSLTVVAGLEETPRGRILDLVASSVVGDIQMRDVKDLATFLDVDLAAHWQVCSGLLDVMTKAEIEALCQEIGLKEFLGKQFAKIMSGKRDEMIKGLLKAEGFEFRGRIPAVMLLK